MDTIYMHFTLRRLLHRSLHLIPMLLFLSSLLAMLDSPRLALLLQRLVILPIQTMCLDAEHADDEGDSRGRCHEVVDVAHAFRCAQLLAE